jgi:hypothetical protein
MIQVNPHHDAPLGRPGHFPEPGRGESVPGTHVQFTPGDLLAWLGEHPVSLHGVRAALPGVLDGRGDHLVGEPLPAVRSASD